LLPQSVYPTDIRDSTLAHSGGDIYGSVPLASALGGIYYTGFAGHRSDSIYSGYSYLGDEYNLYYSSYGGLQYGGDLQWKTPLKGLLIGISRMNQDLVGKAKALNPLDLAAGFVPVTEQSKKNWTNQFYGEYTIRKLRIDSEYRRFVNVENEQISGSDVLDIASDVRGWYVSGAYRVLKHLQVGSYYSRYSIVHTAIGPLAPVFPDQTDTNLPANHIYDKVVTARIDLNKFWDVKVEGHFMNGYGNSIYPDGFYPQVNPQGFTPNTTALVVKTSFNF
jgi:hypothetical protein